MNLGVAFVGPVAAVALVGWRAAHGSLSPFFYFPDAITAACVNLWLAFRFVESLWDGSASEPREARWTREQAARGWLRMETAARRWTVHTFWTAVAAFVLARLLHVPLSTLDIAIFATGPASMVISFELCGWWLADRSTWVRHLTRASIALVLGAFAAAWLLRARSQGLLGQDPLAAFSVLVSGSVWNWFLPARWTLDLLESLGNGGPFLAQLLPLLGCATLLSLLYAWLPLPKTISNLTALAPAVTIGEDRA